MFSFDDNNWVPFHREKLKELRIFPNTLYFNKTSQEGALLSIKSSKYLDFAIGEAGIKYLHEAKKANRIIEGYVALFRNGTWNTRIVVIQKPIDEVGASFANFATRADGPYGPYWLVNSNLTPNAPLLSYRSYSVDEAPY